MWIEHSYYKPQLSAQYNKGHETKIIDQAAFDKIKNMYETEFNNNTDQKDLPDFNTLMNLSSAIKD